MHPNPYGFFKLHEELAHRSFRPMQRDDFRRLPAVASTDECPAPAAAAAGAGHSSVDATAGSRRKSSRCIGRKERWASSSWSLKKPYGLGCMQSPR